MEEARDYKYLQKKIDRVISKYGSEGLINFLEIIDGEDEKARLCIFILNCVSGFYGVSLKAMISAENKKQTHSEPRKICYFMLKEHCGYSFGKISLVFNRKDKSRVHGGFKDIEYFLANPKFNVGLVANYRTIEKQILEFRALIKEQKTKDETITNGKE